MAGREDSTRGKGRGRKGRNPGLRQSLRAQGLPPEEQPSLEEVEKAALERNAAKRKAAAEKKEKESPGVQDRDAPDADVPDAHHAVPDAVAPDVEEKTPSDSARSTHSSASVEFVGVSAPDVPTQASVGGAVKVKCPAEGGPSGSLKPRSDVIVLDDSEGEAEGAAQGDTIEPSSLQPELSSTRQVLPASGPSSLGAPPSPPSRMTDVIDLTADEDLDERAAWNSESEYVSSPTVRYEWPSPGPNFQAWYATANATSEYIATRTSMARQSDAWIFEWNLVRLSPNAVNDDLFSLSVDLDTLSAVECTALLQKLFFEAGFRFRNLIPGWSQTRTSRLNPEVVLGVAQDLQHLLALELLNWRDIASGVPLQIVLAPGLNVPKPDAEEDNLKDIMAEDREDDLFMSDYQAGVLGPECLQRLEGIGIRTVRSPVSSSLGEPDLKRQHPPPSSIPSLRSYLSLRTRPKIRLSRMP
ncbi:hypothetical protein F444_15078 [Phytophthora nicotianae P1976]|uniref:Uncharacterized protein n=1 Tax=Phytophthora nicotianae P1976 TaxID=1317066 RepID=A0A080ZN49_PHYNI|nr:hypothetical protein F444_15078 [Phytophthora nicotianae P1976]